MRKAKASQQPVVDRRTALIIVTLVYVTLLWGLNNSSSVHYDLPPYFERNNEFILALTPAEQSIVTNRQSEWVSAKNCPPRYVFVNPEGFGGHHKQLQQLLNIAIWARKIGRTAVLGWFRRGDEWISATEYYDFTRVIDSYCVVTPQQMLERIAANLDVPLRQSASCFGQNFEDTPLTRYVRGAFECAMAPSVPSLRHGDDHLTQQLLNRVKAVNETLLVVGGELAYAIRGGIGEYAAIFGLLEPSAAIRSTVQSIRTSKISPLYVGISLRGENSCLQIVAQRRKEEGGRLLASVSSNAWRLLEQQCELTLEDIERFMAIVNIRFDHQSTFVGSKYVDAKVETALKELGAVTNDELDISFESLAADFFLLSGGKYFFGNQLTSIAQNACYRRLGRGLSCDGMVPLFSRYLARNVETGQSHIQDLR